MRGYEVAFPPGDVLPRLEAAHFPRDPGFLRQHPERVVKIYVRHPSFAQGWRLFPHESFQYRRYGYLDIDLSFLRDIRQPAAFDILRRELRIVRVPRAGYATQYELISN